MKKDPPATLASLAAACADDATPTPTPTPENTPVPGGGSWVWDAAHGCWAAQGNNPVALA